MVEYLGWKVHGMEFIKYLSCRTKICVDIFIIGKD
jgi:hypothetical protein